VWPPGRELAGCVIARWSLGCLWAGEKGPEASNLTATGLHGVVVERGGGRRAVSMLAQPRGVFIGF
jgi:hypothetical protein